MPCTSARQEIDVALGAVTQQYTATRPYNPATPRGVRAGRGGGPGPQRPDAPTWVTTPRSILPRREAVEEIWLEHRQTGNGTPQAQRRAYSFGAFDEDAHV